MTNTPMTPLTIDPDPLAPYAICPGWRAGGLLFLSGQASISPAGEIVGANDFDLQVEQTFANIGIVLAAAGSDLSRIVKVTIYLTDMANFEKVVAARKRYFTAPYPADTIVEVRALALPELMIEIDVIAAD